MKDINRLRGGLFGLLVGDALGVPYEFHYAADIPPYELIEMLPPDCFERAHKGVPVGTWSDDGAQALCLLDSLLNVGRFDLNDFSDKLLAWYDEGLWAVENNVFDVGVQTSVALDAYRSGIPAQKCGLIKPEGKGNGALMRVLPLVLWHNGSNEELVEFAHEQCLITHGNITNQVCCALYCLLGRGLLEGMDIENAATYAVSELRQIYKDNTEYSQEFEFRLRPDEDDIWFGRGGGYVVDSLRSAVMIMKKADSFEQAAKTAVALGDDTDTTACITGGLAGLYFGYDDIPERWLKALRDIEKAEVLFDKLVKG